MGAFNFLVNSQTALNTSRMVRAQQKANAIAQAQLTKGFAQGWVDGQLNLEQQLKSGTMDLATATTNSEHYSAMEHQNEYNQGWHAGQRKMVQWLNER